MDIVGRHVGDGLEPSGDAGVVDQDVEPSGRGGHVLGGSLNACRVGHVECNEPPAELVRRLLPEIGIASSNPDVIAVGQQTARRLTPEALVCSSDE